MIIERKIAMFKKKKSMNKEFSHLENNSLQDLYEKGADFIEKALEKTNIAIIAYLERDYEKFHEIEKEVISIEAKSDDIHDHIIQRLYSGEVMVFSRADRYFIITQMDDIVDRAQDAIYNTSVFKIKNIPNSLAISISSLVNSLKIIGSLVDKAVKTIFKDFEATLPIIRNIEKIKSDCHKEFKNFYKKLYAEKLEAKEIMYFDKLITSIYEIIFRSNKFVDGLRRTIFKYKL